MNENTKALLQKLKALADRGVGGEKDNAEVKLQALLKKYNLNMSDIDESVGRTRIFKVKHEHTTLFIQIASNVLGDKDVLYDKRERGKTRTYYIKELIDLDFIELSEKYSFYARKYEADLETFYRAFIYKNELQSKTVKYMSDLTPEELEAWERAQQMARGMDKHKHLKQIG